MGKLSCQCIYTESVSQSRTRSDYDKVNLPPASSSCLARLAPHIRRKWSCFNNEDWAGAQCVVLSTSALPPLRHLFSIRKLPSPHHHHCQHNQSGGIYQSEFLETPHITILSPSGRQRQVWKGFSECFSVIIGSDPSVCCITTYIRTGSGINLYSTQMDQNIFCAIFKIFSINCNLRSLISLSPRPKLSAEQVCSIASTDTTNVTLGIPPVMSFTIKLWEGMIFTRVNTKCAT